ncbi:MAG: GNAT family N-acetyltransferase [Calditrichaceae bacterium]|nr:GNAT family N-acetyltransferase [Calditrichaceae bacterium]
MEQKKIFNPKKNKMLQHCDYQLFLLEDNDKTIGRIAAFVNHAANIHWHDKIGFFGHYECINSYKAAALLFSTAENWLKEKGMDLMRGPWSFVTQDFGWIVDGFKLPPVVLSSYNHPYYNNHLKIYGFKKSKDLLVYNCDVYKGYVIPDRFITFNKHIEKRYDISVRPINVKKLKYDVETIVRITNESLSSNWGFYPIENDEVEDIIKDLKPIIHPEAILIAENKGRPIGYLLAIPDINHLFPGLSGRLFPIGIFRLLFGIKKINRYRIWAMGIYREYQQKGISVLLFQKLNEALAVKKVYVEANYVLEDNHLMNNALRQLQFNLVKKYRVYDKEL